MTIPIYGYRDVWWILIDSLLYIRYPYWGIFPSPWWDCVEAALHRLMIIVGCLPHDFDIKYHTGAYAPLLGEIVFGQRYINGWSLLVVYLTTSTSNIHTRAYSPLHDEIMFGQRYIDGWSLVVVYLMTLTSDLILEHIFPIFFQYPWDWDNDQLCFRLCTSLWLLKIDCIKTSLHGFVEIEMDHIRFQPRNMGGSFSQMLMR